MTARRLTLLAVAVAAGVGASAPAVSSAAATADDQVPVKGQVLTMGTMTSGPPTVVTVHGVRRVEGATVVYWSLGVPAGAPAPSGFTVLGKSSTSFSKARVAQGLGDVGLTDAKALKTYRPLQPGPGKPCVCSPNSALTAMKPGQASVMWSAVVPLPPEVTTVDVTLAEQIVPDVPVEDGPLEPVAETDKEPHVLGMGWPEVDEEAISAAVTPTPAAYDLTSRVSNLEQTVTKSPGQVTLSANVLFAKDSATLAPKAQATITAAAAEIKASGGGKALTVTGHADSDAAASYNLQLSKRRADAVAAALTRALGSGYTVKTVGKGETEPIADNKTPEGKAKNRRVAITYAGGK